jgi:hypothetical protein
LISKFDIVFQLKFIRFAHIFFGRERKKIAVGLVARQMLSRFLRKILPVFLLKIGNEL